MTGSKDKEESMQVIDWDEALQKCGDDEDFLRELLGDLKTETDQEMEIMEEIIRVRNEKSTIFQQW